MYSQTLKNRQRGFTLLELIIVFSVIAIMSTVGIAAFVNYSKQQTLQAAYLDLLNTLNVAKSYSISQPKPQVCSGGPLLGYKVSFDFTHSNNTYNFYTECQGYEQLIKKSTFPSGITFNDSITTSDSITFPILSSDVPDCASTDCIITISGYANQDGTTDERIITVTGAGLITGSK